MLQGLESTDRYKNANLEIFVDYGLSEWLSTRNMKDTKPEAIKIKVMGRDDRRSHSNDCALRNLKIWTRSTQCEYVTSTRIVMLMRECFQHTLKPKNNPACGTRRHSSGFSIASTARMCWRSLMVPPLIVMF